MGFRRPSLKTKKLETTATNLIQDASATQTIVLATAKNDPTADVDVPIGSKVKWAQIEFNLNTEVTGLTNTVHWMIAKNPGGLITFNPLTYGQSNRKFVFQRGMEMLPKNVSTLIKRIIFVRIPPRYKRMDESDTLSFIYRAALSQDLNFCMRATAIAEV